MPPITGFISGAGGIPIPTDNFWSWGDNSQGQLGRLGGGYAQVNSDLIIWAHASNFNSNYIKDDGTLWASGQFDRTIGDGVTINPTVFTQVGVVSNWERIKGKRNSKLLLNSSGRRYGWGENSNLELGNGNNIDTTTIALLDAIVWDDAVTAIRGGCGIRSDGRLMGWGKNNTLYSIGDGALPGDAVDRSAPVLLNSTSTSWEKVEQGLDTRLGLKSTGSLYAWGKDVSGSSGLGVPSGTRIASPTLIPGTWKDMSIGYFSVVAIKADGTLWEWGWTTRTGVSVFYDAPSQIGTDSDWDTCYVGENSQSSFHLICGAVKDDGRLFTWGHWNVTAGLARTAVAPAVPVGVVEFGMSNFTFYGGNRMAFGDNHMIIQTKEEIP